MSFLSGLEHFAREAEPLAPYTWFRLGGPAEFFAEPTSPEELAELIRRARENELPVRLLGGGSNVLVREEGAAGVVVHLSAPAFGHISVRDRTIVAGGGARLSHVISTAVREGLAGLESLVGVPGTVGGALHGNTGSGSVDIGQWTRGAEVMTRSGEVLAHGPGDLRFSYRQSSLDELVILNARFELEPEDPRGLAKRMQKHWIVRKSHQPIANQNTGCIFKDAGGMTAASMIEQAGLKNLRVGEAEVSDRDANFIVANPGATSSDVLRLIDQLRSGVAERLGVELELEIDVW